MLSFTCSPPLHFLTELTSLYPGCAQPGEIKHRVQAGREGGGRDPSEWPCQALQGGQGRKGRAWVKAQFPEVLWGPDSLLGHVVLKRPSQGIRSLDTESSSHWQSLQAQPGRPN